jgi:hypothetical protein
MIPPTLITLVYELLDAHQDTLHLAADRREEAWRAHLEYLRALQRTGRQLLAVATAADRSPPKDDSRPPKESFR